MESITRLTLAASMLTLAACGGGTGPGGGGGTSDETDNTLAFDAASSASSDLSFVAMALDGGVSTGGAVYDRAAQTIDGEDGNGTFDPSTGVLTTTDGDIITLTLTGEFGGTAVFEGPDGTAFGVFGVSASNAPTSGSVSYAGTTDVTIVDGTGVYELSGDATALADFNDASLDVVLNNLDGSHTDAFGVPQGNIEDVAVIEIGNAGIDGAAITGGVASFDSNVIAVDLSGSQTTDHEGSFFGPDFDELGGAVLIDDSTSGSLIVYGTYTGD